MKWISICPLIIINDYWSDYMHTKSHTNIYTHSRYILQNKQWEEKNGHERMKSSACTMWSSGDCITWQRGTFDVRLWGIFFFLKCCACATKTVDFHFIFFLLLFPMVCRQTQTARLITSRIMDSSILAIFQLSRNTFRLTMLSMVLPPPPMTTTRYTVQAIGIESGDARSDHNNRP